MLHLLKQTKIEDTVMNGAQSISEINLRGKQALIEFNRNLREINPGNIPDACSFLPRQDVLEVSLSQSGENIGLRT